MYSLSSYLGSIQYINLATKVHEFFSQWTLICIFASTPPLIKKKKKHIIALTFNLIMAIIMLCYQFLEAQK